MNFTEQLWARRRFITTLAGAGAAMAINPPLAWIFEAPDPRVAEIVAKTMGIDTHNHVDVPLREKELPGPKIDLSGAFKKSGLSAITMTFAVDYQKLPNKDDGYHRFIAGLDAMDVVLKDNNIKRSLTLNDLKAAHQAHTPTVIQSVEGCHFLEGQAGRVQEAYNRGIRQLGLLHDNDASISLGDVYTNVAKFGGLTQLGVDAIKECDRLGILIDLAHASNDTIDAALKVTKNPVLISHTGLDTQLGNNPFMAKMMRPRLISKEQAKKVADAGGVIGVWTHLADTPLDYAKNIRAMVNVMGIDHVCIGTDTKLTQAYKSPYDVWERKPEKKEDNKDKQNTAPQKEDNKKQDNKNANGNRPGERTNFAWDGQKEGFYYTVVDALLKADFTEDEIAKIGGGNFCRVFNSATGGN